MDAEASVLKELRRRTTIDEDSVVVVRSLLRHGRRLVAVECNTAQLPSVRIRALISLSETAPSEVQGSYIGPADASAQRSTVWSNFGSFTVGDLQVIGGWISSDAEEVELIDSIGRRIRERTQSGVVVFGELREDFGPAVEVKILDGGILVMREPT